MNSLVKISTFMVFCAINCCGMNISNENWQKEPVRTTRDKESLRAVYSEMATKMWKPMTVAYLRNNPSAEESKILQRYINEFVGNAFQRRAADLSLEEIHDEGELALMTTPTNGARLHYILTGRGLEEGSAFFAISCAVAWKKELQKIEQIIAEKKQ